MYVYNNTYIHNIYIHKGNARSVAKKRDDTDATHCVTSIFTYIYVSAIYFAD